MKPRYQVGNQPQKENIQKSRKESQRNNVYWQEQQFEDWFDD